MSFKKSLEIGTSRNKELNSHYEKRFRNVVDIIEVDDQEEQYKGIDKHVILHTGKIVTIEEKTRAKDYGDIFLELYSNKESRRLGWLYTAQAEYITYITPKNIYTLPTELLKSAWAIFKHGWERKYKKIECKNTRGNGTFTTVGIAIPVKELMSALNAVILNNPIP